MLNKIKTKVTSKSFKNQCLQSLRTIILKKKMWSSFYIPYENFCSGKIPRNNVKRL